MRAIIVGVVLLAGRGVDAKVVAVPSCTQITDAAPTKVATAATADEYALTINVDAGSATNWGQAGNEALVLEVSGSHHPLIGHLILHQGHVPFDYTMHVGALEAGESLAVAVSKLSAPKAVRKASVCKTTLAAVSTLGAAAEGIVNAPEFRWPVQKSFDDVPLLVGWSKAHASYQTVMTNENGGTAEICGGGASGMQAEIARWGRSTDIEDHYHYGAQPSWERCTGRAEISATPLRMEAKHPILYEGSGHNRLFESRGGYGRVCGKKKPEKPDGDLDGWNVNNKSDALADDAGHVIILRPLPVDLDALDYPHFGGRREALSDHYAPWMYRITSLELAREGKIDDAKTLAMERYLYVDVQVANVGGLGGTYCAKAVTGGFKVRLTTKQKAKIESPQITKAYASGGKHDWKRVAIALPKGVTAADIDHFTIDAYDNDGMYLTGLGDAFIPVADGENGAKLAYVRQGIAVVADYIDDDSSGCTHGTTHAGPDGVAYRCVGGEVDLP